MAWLKFLHIAGLAMWCAGLLYLPGLLLAHRNLPPGQEFARIRRATKFNYNVLVSPGAFVAIGAGAALLFLSPRAMEGWMFLKLALVSGLVLAHVHYGFVLAALSDNREEPPRLRLYALTLWVSGMILGVLWLVLEKPAITSEALPDALLRPGGLQSAFDAFTPI